MFRCRSALCALAISLAPAAAFADGAMSHGTMPTEAGQGAFAAIAEIVGLLEADPHTDWSKVDINALQHHLADMDAVVLHSTVAAQEIDGGLAMTVTGEGAVIGAIQRMVTAHTAELDGIDGLAATSEPVEAGVILRVTATDPAIQQRIWALGFYGLLATGAHHQAHHFAIASGQSPHNH